MAVKTYSLKKVGNKKASEHFYYREFGCYGEDVLKLDANLPRYLEALIYKLGAAKAIITSGYRTPRYSVSIGGGANDRHTQGMAADVIFYNQMGKVISPATVCCTAEDLGFIGGIARIGDTATHIDTRSVGSKYYGDELRGNNSIWYYKPGAESFYEYFNVPRPKEKSIKYTVKKNVISRTSPFRISGNKALRFKKGSVVRVIKNARVEYSGLIFYKIRYKEKYYYVNRRYLTR